VGGNIKKKVQIKVVEDLGDDDIAVKSHFKTLKNLCPVSVENHHTFNRNRSNGLSFKVVSQRYIVVSMIFQFFYKYHEVNKKEESRGTHLNDFSITYS